jgi:hypothetical protein
MNIVHTNARCSWKSSFGPGYKIPGLGSKTYRMFVYAPETNEYVKTKNKYEKK